MNTVVRLNAPRVLRRAPGTSARAHIYIYIERERDCSPTARRLRTRGREAPGVEDAYSRYRADIPGPPLHGQLHSTLLCCREASCAHECALYIMHLVRLYCVFAMGGARFYTRPTTFIYGLYGFTLFGRLGGGIFRREPGRVKYGLVYLHGCMAIFSPSK